VVESPRRLTKFPYCGRIVPEFGEENIRELIYGSYRIIYLVREEICYVVAIIHGSRDVLRHLKPGEWDIT
jgi:plasmid stabilization system protein ParE